MIIVSLRRKPKLRRKPNTTAKTTEPKTSIGETAARKVLSDWKGKHVVDACNAATQIGLIYAGGVLHFKPGQRHFEIWLRCTIDRRPSTGRWSTKRFRTAEARSSVQPRYGTDMFPLPPTTTQKTIPLMPSVAGMDFAPLEYVIPGYIVEGLHGAGWKAKAW